MPAKTVHLHEKARKGLLAGGEPPRRRRQGHPSAHAAAPVLIAKSWALRRDQGRRHRAKEIDPEGKFEAMGAKIVRRGGDQDGRSRRRRHDHRHRARPLDRARGPPRLCAAGIDPMQIKRGVDRAIEVVVEALEAQSKPVKERERIAQVGTISSNGDEEVGRILADAMEKVGKDGVITVENAQGARDHPRGWSRACVSTAATCRRTSSPTRRR
jgi:chaperonin GroEL